MITILGIGLTTLLGRSWVGQSVSGFEEIAIPGLSRLPIVGQALFNITALDYLALALTPVVWYFLTRTNVGAEITAVGEDPEAADTAGVPVFRIRYGCILLGGALAGVAGAQLSIAFTNFWTSEMIAGRGWIAVALVIFGQWRVGSVFLGAYLFAALDALSFRSADIGLGDEVFGIRLLADLVDVALDPQVMQVYPYLATVVALWYIMRRGTLEELGAPNSLVESYSRERD
jgi:simple sugar transport system permease protein